MNVSSPDRVDPSSPDGLTVGASGEIARDVTCPRCEYNLRGLRGPGAGVVRCPECGMLCDVARIVRTRWNGPWYNAPGFGTVVAPVLYAMVGAIVLPVAWLAGTVAVDGALLPIILAVAVTVALMALWALRMCRAYRYFDGLKGVLLALLVHVLAVAYLATLIWGVVVVLQGVAGAVASRMDAATHLMQVLIGTVIFATGALVCWRGCRYIAHQCIRRHLELR
jgi:hypothetical protein